MTEYDEDYVAPDALIESSDDEAQFQANIAAVNEPIVISLQLLVGGPTMKSVLFSINTNFNCPSDPPENNLRRIGFDQSCFLEFTWQKYLPNTGFGGLPKSSFAGPFFQPHNKDRRVKKRLA